jgi:hypothetical protein
MQKNVAPTGKVENVYGPLRVMDFTHHSEDADAQPQFFPLSLERLNVA